MSFAILGIYVLALLLASSVPVGSSDPVHGGALLHAALPHVHLGSERVAVRSAQLSLGSTIEAGASTTTELPGSGLTPPLPRATADLVAGPVQRLAADVMTWPGALNEPPPDPPPTSLLRT
ncbi:MAG TPA: hypothetical protein VGQ62_12135 [Chloroflexota bacterium]|jgi:hypothetical protein|nr:hypothetical protein [Chloroflexota bacterium]